MFGKKKRAEESRREQERQNTAGNGYYRQEEYYADPQSNSYYGAGGQPYDPGNYGRSDYDRTDYARPGYDQRYYAQRRIDREAYDRSPQGKRRDYGDAYDRSRTAYDRRGGDDQYRDVRYREDRYRDGRYRSGQYQDLRGGARRYDMADGRYPGRRRRRKRRVWLVVLEILLVLILAAGVFVFAQLGRIGRTKLNNILMNSGIGSRAGYTNIVLYGVDSRTGELTKDCHSDTIMICSMNRRSKEVKIVSVYRDTYLDNTNGEYRKATECYFYGGPERSVNMLNKNLDLDIQDYVAVNFNAVVQVIDLLGGIDLEITEEERGYINGYCVENQQVTGVSYTPLESAGYVHLDGIQALAYCRIRYTEGWDYKRTERQRTVLTLVYQKAASQGPAALLQIANTMLPSISTSMGNVELLALVSGIGSYSVGEQAGFPFDKTTANLAAGDCVVPVNLSANVTQLHQFLFSENDYVPSATVQEISNEITAATGI